MNLKKFLGLVLVFSFIGIAAYAQEVPMRGMYVTSDSNAQYKYLTIDGDRSTRHGDVRDLKFYDSTGHNVLFSTRITLINNSSDGNVLRYNFNGGPRHSSGFLRNLTSNSFVLDMGSRRITYTRM